MLKELATSSKKFDKLKKRIQRRNRATSKENGVTFMEIDEKEVLELVSFYKDLQLLLEKNQRTSVVEKLENLKRHRIENEHDQKLEHRVKRQKVEEAAAVEEEKEETKGGFGRVIEVSSEVEIVDEPEELPRIAIDPLDPNLPVLPGTPVPLCGAIVAGEDYIVPAGSAVAAKRRDDPPEWILAIVLRHIPRLNKYKVVDADPDEGPESRTYYIMPRKNLIPLPKWVPEQWNKSTQFSKNIPVLAMFPNTTSFYPATVQVGPKRRKNKNYVLVFEDDEEDGKKCRRAVSPRFVVSLKQWG